MAGATWHSGREVELSKGRVTEAPVKVLGLASFGKPFQFWLQHKWTDDLNDMGSSTRELTLRLIVERAGKFYMFAFEPTTAPTLREFEAVAIINNVPHASGIGAVSFGS